jgi:predicted esterase
MSDHPRSALSRRRFVGGSCASLFALGPGRSSAADAFPVAEDLVLSKLVVPGDPKLARQALVLTPKRVPLGVKLPVLVLLHGLGETGDEELGIRAWSERYGLVDADHRLRHPPVVARTRRYMTEERARAMTASLAERPYEGFVLVCPVTPNVYKLPPPALALDRYADWITDTLLPKVRETAPATHDPARTAIDGCSLGGYIALEVFLRKPESFGAIGTVQAAISELTAPVYANRLHDAIERAGPRALHIESSLWDPTKSACDVLGERLHALGVPHDMDVLSGGHDQIFLREIGGLEMLFWHDRRLAGEAR